MFKRIFTTLFGLFLGFCILFAGVLGIAVMVTYPKLPSLDVVTNYRPKVPLRIYTADGKLINEYGEERRSFTKIEDFPQILKNAVLAAEDKRFYDHWGVDVIGLGRAVLGNLTGQPISGASTITQQVAKNFFLSSERSVTRKFNEALLAYKIEQNLNKNEILELYFNQIYLGQRAYGFAAASQAYFGKPVANLSLAEASMLAGLPKAPSAFNPIVNPKRAKERQKYILGNMKELGMITQAQYDEAINTELHYQKAKLDLDQSALYVGEMARQAMYDKYGENAYTQGFKVYTTINSQEQQAATEALRNGLLAYDRYQAYRGAEAYIDLSKLDQKNLYEALDTAMESLFDTDNMLVAVVLKASNNSVEVYMRGDKIETITGSGLNLAKRAINNSRMKDKQIQPGAVIRVQQDKNDKWKIVQIPEVEGALVSMDTHTGALRAVVGGFDFNHKSFNRAIQAWRQPGSTFKPFIYSAGIERGLTAATPINDAPISIPGMGPRGKAWEPKNSDGRFAGYISLHQALVASKNMVSIRILMTVGLDYGRQYVTRFGFQPAKIPNSLTIALGSGETTPLQMAEGYAVFANGGYRVHSYFIDRIYDGSGNLKAQTKPSAVGDGAKLVIDPRNAFIMYNIMKDITRRGTAARASALGRSDIAGKTGTTNDHKDAWFVGYNPDLVAAVYVGYDRPRSLGRLGFGGTAALPVWIDYMRSALKGKPIVDVPMPKGVVRNGGEYFYQEFQSTNPNLALDNRSAKDVPEDEIDTNNPDLTTNGGTFQPNFGGSTGSPEGGEPANSGNNTPATQNRTEGSGSQTPAKNHTEQAVDNIRGSLF
ncbi:penicillin-binding protein 1A [Neisseria sp. Ec49-e6-T10]|uniref:penicillin-binding protein 1A n=1 Tax=Neisseria sp. Ec49-e6-T10 TaxID=3140744 RepID=UPI003EB6E3E0